MTRAFYVAKGFETEGINLPKRGTKFSAGYDFEVAEDILVPSIWKTYTGSLSPKKAITELFSFDEEGEMIPDENGGFIINRPERIEMNELDEREGFKPTLVPTGIKADMLGDEYLQLANRSSNPKKGLILANGIGVIDKDYFENPDNDGHIFFAFLNLSEEDYVIKKHDKIGQGIFHKYLTVENDTAAGSRTGGFGSTGN